ncbi:hypothetical protein HETIRDRAFT_442140 [Heterobasidion irregulare TC 32-1]|uniref:Uncharacterized protein n=1 Tax=Heterobasidion irregulare (strain TC 32-1) TaxID=747525 RepID=W4JTH4_HETIT|nr:uncharacterized protein HETIRDRAFT_442140 [Heterobasidion irregulare TC 32-1]ETW76852.1 hypothetical protein HETIRDRAFT_442140 [Heterobasidion irregulare TC 32-1]
MTGVERPNSLGADSESPILSNFKAALALFALQRHAFMMLTLWEGVAIPASIMDFIAASRWSGEEADDAHEEDEDDDDGHDSYGDEDHSDDDDDDKSNNNSHTDDNDNVDGSAVPSDNINECSEDETDDDVNNDEGRGKRASDKHTQQSKDIWSRDRGGEDEDNESNGDVDKDDGDDGLEDNDNADGDGVSHDETCVDEGIRVGLLASVSRREQMQTTIPDWLNQVALEH